jgi:phenylalanyl-tRNA synthetase alpha chain
MIHELQKEIEGAKKSFIDELGRIQSQENLQQIRDQYFSRKKGIVTGFFNRLRQFPADLRPEAGKRLNELRDFVEGQLNGISERFVLRPEKWIDCSLPESQAPVGHFHLLSHIRRQIEDIFLNIGYEIADGPEIESEYYNFEALNIPKFHPARDEQDTFFLGGFEGMILRTHTSPVQIRYMLAHPPPIQIIVPGKVFRKDDPDATHTPVFHQVEGLLVDRGVNFSHLKGTLEQFIRALFGHDVKIRFRPGYFPFTEPSAEVDMSCFLCSGGDAECKICKGTGWLEILGSGMVHPNVLRNGGVDPMTYSGFAFGMGIERIAMLKYQVPDLRMLYENDLRLIEQFG